MHKPLSALTLAMLAACTLSACDKGDGYGNPPTPSTASTTAKPPAVAAAGPAATPAPGAAPATNTSTGSSGTYGSSASSGSTGSTGGSTAMGAGAAASGGGAGDKGQAVYTQTCAACHGTGVTGAPKLGDKADWGARVAQGKDTLYTHALQGFTGKKGTMPPKGGNTSLPDADVKAAVDYMVSQAK